MGLGAAEGKCSVCSKHMLVAFNIIFCFIGIGLVVVGTYAYIQLHEYSTFFGETHITGPAIVLILFGCVTFAVAAIGCLGAFKESSFLLFMFSTVVGVVLVTELVCGVVAFIFKEQLQAFVEENANLLMKVYNESIENEVKAVWDKMHENFECCGAKGRLEWQNATIAMQQNGVVPASCKNYTSGCVESFVTYARDNILILGAAATALAGTQIAGIVLSCMLGCSLRKSTQQQ